MLPAPIVKLAAGGGMLERYAEDDASPRTRLLLYRGLFNGQRHYLLKGTC